MDPSGQAQRLAVIYGEALSEKYFNESNKLAMANAVRYLMDAAPEPIQVAFKTACQNVLGELQRNQIEVAYNFKG